MKHKKLTYVISDVHGMLDRLKTLISKLKIKKDDTLIFLGDYIDRGPDSQGVIDFILSLKDKCNLITLKGNHEDFAIGAFQFMEGRLSNINFVKSWMLNGGSTCLESYDIESYESGYHFACISKMEELHGDFFNSLQLTYEDEYFIYVHGYLSDQLNLDEQNEQQCLWGRFDDIKPHKSGKIVVCGHTIHKEPQLSYGHKICIDTGSFMPNGCITAMIIDGTDYRFENSN